MQSPKTLGMKSIGTAVLATFANALDDGGTVQKLATSNLVSTLHAAVSGCNPNLADVRMMKWDFSRCSQGPLARRGGSISFDALHLPTMSHPMGDHPVWKPLNLRELRLRASPFKIAAQHCGLHIGVHALNMPPNQLAGYRTFQ